MTTAIYTRTSKENNDGSYSISSQVQYCLDYAVAHSMNIIEDFIYREDFTGAVIERPEVTKLRNLVKSHAIDSVIIYSTDRLARDIYVGTHLFDEMCKNGVTLHIVKWGTFVRADNASDKLHFNMEMSISDFEKENIKERLMRGKVTKAALGKYVAHARPLFGYDVNEWKDNLVLNEYAPYVKEILESYGLKQINPQKICDSLNVRNVPNPGSLKADAFEASANKKFKMGTINQEDYEKFLAHAEKVRGSGIWNPQMIHSILNNVWDYTGDYKFQLKGVTYHVDAPPIISREVAEACERMLAVGKSRFARKEGVRPYLMARRLTCTCGRSYGVRPKKSKYFDGYYSCMSWVNNYDGRSERCPNTPIRNDIIDPLTKQFIRELLNNPKKLFKWQKQQHTQDETTNQKIREEIEQHDAKIEELQKKLHRTLDRLTDNLDDDEVAYYEDQKDNLKKLLAKYRQRKEELEESLIVPTVTEETIKEFEDLGAEFGPMLDQIHDVTFWRGIVDKLNLTGIIGIDEKGQYIDFVLFGQPRKREHIQDLVDAEN